MKEIIGIIWLTVGIRMIIEIVKRTVVSIKEV